LIRKKGKKNLPEGASVLALAPSHLSAATIAFVTAAVMVAAIVVAAAADHMGRMRWGGGGGPLLSPLLSGNSISI
jgi:hypothetical protein